MVPEFKLIVETDHVNRTCQVVWWKGIGNGITLLWA